MVLRPLDLVKLGSWEGFFVDYWVELLIENVNEEIVLKYDEHHVNIDLGKVD